MHSVKLLKINTYFKIIEISEVHIYVYSLFCIIFVALSEFDSNANQFSSTFCSSILSSSSLYAMPSFNSTRIKFHRTYNQTEI